MKKGKFSKAERDFIAANSAKMSAKQIAEHLDRTIETVSGLIGTKPVPTEQLEIRNALKQSMAWQHLLEEFTTDEVRYFEEKYSALKEQFSEGLMASEEGQLFKAIKTELMMHRNLIQQRKSQEEIDRLEEEKRLLLRRKAAGEHVEVEEFLNSDTFLSTAYASKQSKSNEYHKLDQQHQDVMKGLKATREQRITKIENNKRTLMDLIRILDDQDAAERADRTIDLMKKQADKELRRIGGVHKYADGTFDRPILSAETVTQDE